MEPTDPYEFINRVDRIVDYHKYISDGDFIINDEETKKLGVPRNRPFAFGLRIFMHDTKILVLDMDDVDYEIVNKKVESLKKLDIFEQIDIAASSRTMSNTPVCWHIHCGLKEPQNTIKIIQKMDVSNMCKNYIRILKNNMQQVIRVSRKFNDNSGYKTKIMRYSTNILRNGEWKEYTSVQSIVPLIIQDGQSVNITQKPKRFRLNLRAL